MDKDPPTPPEPNKITYYPLTGELRYLCRKTITSTDVRTGFRFVGLVTKRYLKQLPICRRIKVTNKVLVAMLYTPESSDEVELSYDNQGIQLLKSPGLVNSFTRNNFEIGTAVHCWSVYHAEGQGQKLSFLIQRAENEIEQAEDVVEAQADDDVETIACSSK